MGTRALEIFRHLKELELAFLLIYQVRDHAPDNIWCVVLREVVHNHHLKPIRWVVVCQNRIQAGLDGTGLVASRHNDRNERRAV